MAKVKEKNEDKECCDEEYMKKKWHRHNHAGAMGGFYFVAFIGVAVYYIQQSEGFWMGVLGFLKACVWPALLAYKVFTLLHM